MQRHRANRAYRTLLAGVLAIVFAGPALGQDAAPQPRGDAAATAAPHAPADSDPATRANIRFVYPVAAVAEREPS